MCTNGQLDNTDGVFAPYNSMLARRCGYRTRFGFPQYRYDLFFLIATLLHLGSPQIEENLT